jgi:glycosyltransferase involved in cell wall biosynthesis
VARERSELIYLNAEVVSGLGEDTFWTWFHREFPNSAFEEPRRLTDKDAVLRYSTLGFLPIVGKQIALCWELYPAMRERFGSTLWDDKIAMVLEAARYATYRTVASDLTRPLYEPYGTVDIIPIGIDIDVFRPLANKEELRAKHGLPADREVGVWVGTAHPMKGFALLLEYARQHPDIHWVTICKTEHESVAMPGAANFVHVNQETLCELINAGDFFLSTSLLRPFFMAEWEAMACDAPMRMIGEQGKEFAPSAHPRDDVLRLGWDRAAVKKKWELFFVERGITW